MKREERSDRGASGRFLLRLQPGLHAALRSAAASAGMSLNDYCARKLAAPIGPIGTMRGGIAIIERAADLFGDDFVGAVVYGSWARGEATETSDVDALIVVAARIPINRALYRSWDEKPLTWDTRHVDPHFVHLPAEEALAGSTWAEAAIDGIVLFEQRFVVSIRLAQVRRDILAGRLVRKFAHGQPYWAEVA